MEVGMLAKLCLGMFVVLAMSACTSFQPSPAERGVAFKLKPCNDDHLREARQRLTSTDVELEFNESWVCVTAPLEDQKAWLPLAQPDPTQQSEKQREEAQAFLNRAEELLRTEVEGPFIKREGGRPAFGIALAGGGSKAAAFGTGVLAGLADVDMLDSASYISSVSGGSYAAYFYYAHRIFPGVPGRKHADRPTSQQLYWDCVQRRRPGLADPEVIEAVNAYGPCRQWHLLPDWDSSPAETIRQENKYQGLLRCAQDVFNPGVCTTDVTSRDLGVSKMAILGSVTLFPLSGVASILFDWGISVSPSARTYRSGIGFGYGTTASSPQVLYPAREWKVSKFQCQEGLSPEGFARDCERDRWFITPEPLTFQELRAGLLESRTPGATPLPFWIVNAAAPKYRSELGWWTIGKADSTNSDMFEMTAVSHGSGRYGYVPAPVSLHDMNVLDAVGASAAFLDSSQLKYRHPVVRGTIGAGLRIANLDWGSDIPNYNVSDESRNLHRLLPIPFYYLDGAYRKFLGDGAGSAEKQDRVRSAFIRLVDGGNGENLGVYALLKREVRTIVISDAAADPSGDFSDICALRARLPAAPPTVPRFLYIPGLADLERHCDKVAKGEEGGYDIRAWPFKVPVLMGCLRLLPQSNGTAPCSGMGPGETRLIIVKPAIHLANVIERQYRLPEPSTTLEHAVLKTCLLPGNYPGTDTPLLNCDSSTFITQSWVMKDNHCQPFPQHSTVSMTLNSSATLFGAYRELARQYLRQAGPLLKGLAASSPEAGRDFETYARDQGAHPISRQGKCNPDSPPAWFNKYVVAQ
jgi:hypothetical protein